ncbi:hypothetical protein [Butyrivibrio sp. AE3009]|uniref:hypothetical protein n=1 Tax=Butyrivibrio sp. AE3009 TaxID=1280666 RepID=UPI0003B4B89D|nr:hypothetical protein [Butyrivibrio sp. AE3009]
MFKVVEVVNGVEVVNTYPEPDMFAYKVILLAIADLDLEKSEYEVCIDAEEIASKLTPPVGETRTMLGDIIKRKLDGSSIYDWSICLDGKDGKKTLHQIVTDADIQGDCLVLRFNHSLKTSIKAMAL